MLDSQRLGGNFTAADMGITKEFISLVRFQHVHNGEKEVDRCTARCWAFVRVVHQPSRVARKSHGYLFCALKPNRAFRDREQSPELQDGAVDKILRDVALVLCNELLDEVANVRLNPRRRYDRSHRLGGNAAKCPGFAAWGINRCCQVKGTRMEQSNPEQCRGSTTQS